VIGLGFLAFAGRLSWFTAGAVVIGIGLVFGAPNIVDEMISAVGN
ncbi:TrbC/VirB2 family protein, partial [Mesorhizobium sp.]